jgi:hypothetical protein
MASFRLLLLQAIILIAGNCCFAEGSQIVVSVNNQELTIKSVENLNSNSVERLIAQRVRQVLLSSAIQKAQVNVPDQAISNCIDLYLSAGGEKPAVLVSNIESKGESVVKALRKVVVDHEDKDSVYRQYLSTSMSHTEWDAWINSYSTTNKIDKLESLIPHSVTDIKHSSEASLKSDIELWLLLQRLTKDISPSADEIQFLYKMKYPNGNPAFDQVVNELKAEATQRLKEAFLTHWWQAQIAGSNIHVPAEYSGADRLIEIPPSPPFLPNSIIALLEKME